MMDEEHHFLHAVWICLCWEKVIVVMSRPDPSAQLLGLIVNGEGERSKERVRDINTRQVEVGGGEGNEETGGKGNVFLTHCLLHSLSSSAVYLP